MWNDRKEEPPSPTALWGGGFFNIYTFIYFFLFWKYEFAMSLNFVLRLKSGTKSKPDPFPVTVTVCVHQPIIFITSTAALSVPSNHIPRPSAEAKRPQQQYEHPGSVAAASRSTPSNSLRSLSPPVHLSSFKLYIYWSNFVLAPFVVLVHASSLKLV